MNLKDKIKNYGFWMSLTASVILMLQVLGKAFDFMVNDELITSIVTSVCGIFIVLGLISNPASGTGYVDKLEEPEEKDN
jgi:uncharacterized membrane protein